MIECITRHSKTPPKHLSVQLLAVCPRVHLAAEGLSWCGQVELVDYFVIDAPHGPQCFLHDGRLRGMQLWMRIRITLE